MLVWIVMLGIIGLILLMAEALIPGFGIFGIIGGACMLGSTAMAGIKYGFGVFLMMIAAFIVLLLLFISVANKKKDKFVLKDVLNTQDFDESILQDMQGKQGITITTVQPYGKMEVEGKQIDVCSEGGYIEKNKIVQIVQIRGKIVVVKEV